MIGAIYNPDSVASVRTWLRAYELRAGLNAHLLFKERVWCASLETCGTKINNSETQEKYECRMNGCTLGPLVWVHGYRVGQKIKGP